MMDNRDTGLSHGPEGSPPSVEDLLAAREDPSVLTPPYTLSDMAADIVALLDHLGQGRRPRHRPFHGRHDRAAAGDRAPGAGLQPDIHHVDHGQSRPSRARRRDRRRVARHGCRGRQGDRHRAEHPGSQGVRRPPLRLGKRWGSRASRGPPSSAPTDPRARCASWPRYLAAEDRRKALAKLAVPTLVIHGNADPLGSRRGRTRHHVRHPRFALCRDRQARPRSLRTRHRRDRRGHHRAHRERPKSAVSARTRARARPPDASASPVRVRVRSGAGVRRRRRGGRGSHERSARPPNHARSRRWPGWHIRVPRA